MSIIQDMIKKIRENKKIKNENLYIGYVGNFKIVNKEDGYDGCSVYKRDKVVCKLLTSRQRDRYLKGKYPTFLDAENCQLDKYLAIKNSNIQYYTVPSMNNKILPAVPHFPSSNLELLADLDEVLIDVKENINERMWQSKFTLNEIRQMEREL